jgi:hypothetical protein
MTLILIWKLEKACTFGCARLVLLPSWLMYPNNALKAFVHFVEQLGQFVMQSILKKISSYWLPLQQSKSKLEPYVLEISLDWNGTCIRKCHQKQFLSAKEFLHCCDFFFKKNIISWVDFSKKNLKKIQRKRNFFGVNFTRSLFLAFVDRQTIYFVLERF